MTLDDSDLAEFALAAYTVAPTWTGQGRDQSIHVVRSQVGRAVIYAPRGSKEPNDWARDFSLLPWNLHELINDVGMINRIGVGHAGILNATLGIYNDVRDSIAKDIANGFEVYLSGHSLGGGIVGFLALLLTTDRMPITHVAAFESPRIMRHTGVDILCDVSMSYYIHGNDPVPHVPPILIHPRELIYIGTSCSNPLDCHPMLGVRDALVANTKAAPE